MEKKNNQYQIQIKIHNWETGFSTIAVEISSSDLVKFVTLANSINKSSTNLLGSTKKVWNWFGNGYSLPETWDGEKYVLDTWYLCKHMEDTFNYKVEDIDLIREFATRFLPTGCDRIESIKFYKVEEVVLKGMDSENKNEHPDNRL